MASKFIGFGCFICAAQRAVLSSNPRHRWQLGVSVDWFLRRLPFRQGHLLACFSCLTICVVTVRVSNRGEHCTVFYCVLRTRLPSFSEVALPVPYRRNFESANSYTLPPLQSVTRLVVCRTSCCVTVTPCPAGGWPGHPCSHWQPLVCLLRLVRRADDTLGFACHPLSQ
jgi:hypothetical protein